MNTNIGDRVNFIDDKACHIKGVIISKYNHKSTLMITIELDSNGGRYVATLLKTVENIVNAAIDKARKS